MDNTSQSSFSSIRDNYFHGTVGDFLRQTISENSEISIVSAYFTIFAYHHLRDNLEKIQHLRFLFGEPRFLKSIDPSKVNTRDFKIEDDKIVIPIESRLAQKSTARELIPPIISSNKSIVTEIEKLVDNILVKKKIDCEANIEDVEVEIDKLIYKLYNLTKEEIKIIEQNEKEKY